VPDLAEALARAGDVWVIGGGSVYAQALPSADELYVTEVRETFAGDTYAPALSPRWSVVAAEPSTGWAESSSGLGYRYLVYRKLDHS
jgi:dihydrofolate reductase